MVEWYGTPIRLLAAHNNRLNLPRVSSFSDTRSYIPPVKIGEVMRGSAIGVVQSSKSKAYPAGTYAVAPVGWTEIAIVKEKDLEKVDVPKNGRVTDALGVLGNSPFRSIHTRATLTVP